MKLTNREAIEIRNHCARTGDDYAAAKREALGDLPHRPFYLTRETSVRLTMWHRKIERQRVRHYA